MTLIPTTNLGSTNLKVSKIGLGMAALGRPGYINLGHQEDLNGEYEVSKMETHAHKVLTKAHKLGITYFDAAQSYGKAEEFLKTWLGSTHPENVVVGSKWGYYYTANWQIEAEKHEIKDHTVERLKKQWPESKARLEPYLKLYQIHSATFESGVLENSEVIDELWKIKNGGYLIGLTLSGPQQAPVLEKAMTIDNSHQLLFDTVQATCNILEHQAMQVLELARKKGMGVIVKEALANGKLTSRNSSAPYYEKLQKLATEYQTTVDALAIAWVMKLGFVDIVLSGAANEKHLKSNVSAANVDMKEEDWHKLAEMQLPVEKYWKERKALEWN